MLISFPTSSKFGPLIIIPLFVEQQNSSIISLEAIELGDLDFVSDVSRFIFMSAPRIPSNFPLSVSCGTAITIVLYLLSILSSTSRICEMNVLPDALASLKYCLNFGDIHSIIPCLFISNVLRRHLSLDLGNGIKNLIVLSKKDKKVLES